MPSRPRRAVRVPTCISAAARRSVVLPRMCSTSPIHKPYINSLTIQIVPQYIRQSIRHLHKSTHSYRSPDVNHALINDQRHPPTRHLLDEAHSHTPRSNHFGRRRPPRDRNRRPETLGKPDRILPQFQRNLARPTRSDRHTAHFLPTQAVRSDVEPTREQAEARPLQSHRWIVAGSAFRAQELLGRGAVPV